MIDVARDWLVAEIAGRWSGTATWPHAPADGAISVDVDGTVHPEFRRQGIGSELVARSVERARAYVAERGAGSGARSR